MKPLLAGRDRGKIEPLARELDCAFRTLALSSASDLSRELDGVSAVLHCAGPFSETSASMVEACLAAGAHYLDITGEIDVIESISRQHERACAASVSLLPAVGMDVVPSDCLAATLAAALPEATHLELAFAAPKSLSPGTAKTVWKQMGRGGRVRSAGQIIRVPFAWKTMRVPFPRGSRWAMTIPWGDVASAYHTTGIPDIEVYVASPRRQIRVIERLRWMAPLAALWPIQSLGRWWIDRRVRGPDSGQRADDRTEFWGRVTNAEGQMAEATLETPNGYTLTIQTALAALQAVSKGRVPVGFVTPAKALGTDFMDTCDDAALRWIRRPD
jgi:short subunit dehydrogenase-like uncharacterized protein